MPWVPLDLPGWRVYIVRCSDGTLYTGCTSDLERRLHEHNHSKSGAKYTMSRRPVELVAAIGVLDRSTAQRIERMVKSTPRDQKLAKLLLSASLDVVDNHDMIKAGNGARAR